jgi:hypothetical protein
MKRNVLRQDSASRRSSDFRRGWWLFPALAGFVTALLLSLWQGVDHSLPAFDGARYHAHILRLSSCMTGGERTVPGECKALISRHRPLWPLLLAAVSALFRLESYAAMLRCNNLLFYPLLCTLFFGLVQKNRSRKEALFATLFLCLSPVFFHSGKALMPEPLSACWILLSWHFLYRSMLGDQPLFSGAAYALWLSLGALTDSAALPYILIPLLLGLPFHPKNLFSSLVFAALGVLLCSAIFPEHARNVFILALVPDTVGSWSVPEAAARISWSRNVFVQAAGFLERTGGVPWTALCCLAMVSAGKRDKKGILFGIAFAFSVFSVLAWMRPTAGRDFDATGYRYQYPLLMLLALMGGAGAPHARRRFFRPCLALLALITLSETLLQSLPGNRVSDFRLSLRIFQTNQADERGARDGTITLFDASTQIVSGGGSSRPLTASPPSARIARKVVRRLESVHPDQTPWFTCISPDARLHHALSSLMVRFLPRWRFQTDQKNPYHPKGLKSELETIQGILPSRRNRRKSIVMLRESDFVLVDELEGPFEPEIAPLLERLRRAFRSMRPHFEPVAELRFPERTLRLYQNRDRFGRELLAASRPRPGKPAPGIFGLWIADLPPDSNESRQGAFFRRFLAESGFEHHLLDTPRLRAALRNLSIRTLILPYGPFYPADLRAELLFFSEHGGNFWFTGGMPLSRPVFSSPAAKTHRPSKKDFRDRLYRSLGWRTDIMDPAFERMSLKRTGPSLPFVPGPKGSFPRETFWPVNGTRFRDPIPRKGNVFPHRVPCSRFYPLFEWAMPSGIPVARPSVFHCFHRNPLGADAGSRILSWQLPSFLESFDSPETAARFASLCADNFHYPVLLVDAFAERILYSPPLPETVPIRVILKNESARPRDATARISFAEEVGQSAFALEKTVSLEASEKKTIRVSVPANALRRGLNLFTVRLGENVFQELGGGLCFGFGPDGRFQDVPRMSIRDKRVLLGKRFPWTGCNYYPSSNYDRVWLRPNLFEIDRDFRTMASLKLKMIRMHYVHRRWYSDFGKIADDSRLSRTLPRFDPIRTARVLLEIAARHRLVLCFDLFSLVDARMGHAGGWSNAPSRYRDPERIAFQDAFLVRFLKATEACPNLSIDLVNEPGLNEADRDSFFRWVEDKCRLIRSLRPDVLITCGLIDSRLASRALDYVSLHADRIPPLPDENRPSIIQEFWPISSASPRAPLHAVKRLSTAWRRTRALGYSALLPWGFADPAALYPFAGDEEAWEARLGVFMRPDGTLKHPSYGNFPAALPETAAASSDSSS